AGRSRVWRRRAAKIVLMSRMGKVLVAMSGGVDSSVAACLLKEQGYECVGVFMRVGRAGRDGGTEGRRDEGTEGAAGRAGRRLKHGCCSVEDALDARAVAARLGIPFHALNFEPDFERIIDYFVDEYAHARTPNPCVMCNIHLKFGKLLRYADLLEAEFVATGHYARILRGNTRSEPPAPAGEHGRAGGRGLAVFPEPPTPAGGQLGAESGGNRPAVCLARARHLAKDQSYVLFGIRRADLSRCLFPLGEIEDKAAVRGIAAELGLTVHDKPDSQEICFVPDRDYRRLVQARRPDVLRPGPIVDAAGRMLGTHAGLAGYTVGQRRGLGAASGARTQGPESPSSRAPIYVTRLNVLENSLEVGPRAELLCGGLVAERVNWLVDPAPRPGEPQPAWIKIRHMHTPARGAITPVRAAACGAAEPAAEAESVEARFAEPQLAVTPGQAAVFYEAPGADGIVLGGGWISAGLRPAVSPPGGRRTG
ncbi:MAG: tRNA 2-thiouridine(34) synthase MnmA, partial [Planctomycetota bacterium]